MCTKRTEKLHNKDNASAYEKNRWNSLKSLLHPNNEKKC
jgi:hypothetical protein